MRVLAAAVIGTVLGAFAGVVVVGLLGVLSSIPFLVDHADDLGYGLGMVAGGFVMFVYQMGIPLGAPIGAVVGLIVGVANHGRSRQPAARPATPPRRETRRTRALAVVIIGVALASIVYWRLVVPIMERRRELAELRAQGDALEREVARLGGRPFYEPGLTRMVDLDNTNVTDDDLFKLSALPGFALVDRLLLSNTRVTDRFVKTLKRGRFFLPALDLSGTQVTDEGLAHLVRLGLPLNWFSFANTRITDAGLDLIPDGANIDIADFRGSGVTERGVVKLFRRVRLHNRIDYGPPDAPKQLRGWSWGAMATNPADLPTPQGQPSDPDARPEP